MSQWEAFAKVLPLTARVNDEGHLEIGGCDATQLAREYGTPLFVLDERALRDRLAQYREAFGGENVHYGAKAFFTRSLVPLLLDEGVALDCASGGELYVALSGGFPAERIVLHGNNKSAGELRMAVEAGVGRVVVDADQELEALDAIAAVLGRRQKILIRVTPGIEAHTHEYLKTGVEDSKFGVPIGAPALAAIRRAAGAANVELMGLHSHIGSQIFDLEPFADAGRVMVRFLAEARAATGLPMPELGLGGGLGVRYVPDDDPPPVEDLGKVLLDAVASEAEALGTPVPAVKVEPGRSSVGQAMVTLYTVGVIKEVPGIRTYASVDGGMSDNIRPALYGATYTFCSASRPDAPHDRTYALAGKLCESGDVLTKQARLPELAPGEIVCTATTGAYGYAMASNYNKLPRPAVVLAGDGRARLLARRETYDDLVRLES